MHSPTAAAGSCSSFMNVETDAPAPFYNRSGEGLNAADMSIDTPSYARSLGMGQLGSAAGFAGSLFQGGLSQDLAQSMSIDGVQAEQVSSQAAASSGPGIHFKHTYEGFHLFSCELSL